MNRFLGIGLAAAVVALVALIGLQLIGRSDVGEPGSPPSPTPRATPTAAPSDAAAVVFPPAGLLATGTRHPMVLAGGIPLSISVPEKWTSNGSFLIQSRAGSPEEMQMFFWTGFSPQGIYADPCAHEPSPPVGPSAADLAAAVATVPGTELVSGPSDVTVDGRAGKLVELIVPEDVGCVANSFYLWSCGAECGARYASWLGSTIRIWIIDVDGTRVVIEGETRNETSTEIEIEIDQIVDSIQFE